MCPETTTFSRHAPQTEHRATTVAAAAAATRRPDSRFDSDVAWLLLTFRGSPVSSLTTASHTIL